MMIYLNVLISSIIESGVDDGWFVARKKVRVLNSFTGKRTHIFEKNAPLSKTM